MKNIFKIGLALLAVVVIIIMVIHGLSGGNFALLEPKGIVALKERNLMVLATLLMLLIVLPVFALTIFIAFKYRATNTKATYSPEWDHNRTIEAVWWGLPCLIIAAVAFITWQSSHELDPSKPLASTAQPITIQVVALDWKWLFLYPDQHIATLNYLQFPQNTPVNFEITSDAPMNSFWIPQLGGQIYAMPGMTTRLSLMATELGSFNGSSANLSGQGFAGMKFIAKATSQSDYNAWVKSVQASAPDLSDAGYDMLARPSSQNAPASYRTATVGLYDRVIMKYLPADSMAGMSMNGMNMP